MKGFHTRALVLRVVAFGETDRIVHLLTPTWGLVSAIAKGAARSRRRFCGALDLFHVLAVRLSRRRSAALAQLESARLLDAMVPLREHPDRFALACYLVELVARVGGGGDADAAALFRVARGALEVVAQREVGAELPILLPLRLLDVLGLRPELRCCVRCGRPCDGPGAIFFHVAEGGPRCGSCEGGSEAALAIQLGTLRVLDRGLRLPLPYIRRLALSPSSRAEGGELVRRFTRFHLGVALRSEGVLAQLTRRFA